MPTDDFLVRDWFLAFCSPSEHRYVGSLKVALRGPEV